MFFKKFKKTFTIFLLALLIIPTYIKAYSDYVIPGGENIGIELTSKGVMVVGLYKVGNNYPGRDAGIRIGDIVTKINNTEISSITELTNVMNQVRTNSVSLEYIRDNINQVTTLNLHKDQSGQYKTGLYVKDRITGVGTLTFIDPNSQKFGALGHEIIEKSTGKILEISTGKIFETIVTGTKKSENGNPGEKTAKFITSNLFGNVDKNTDKGIFGNFTGEMPNRQLYKVASKKDVELGNAKILTVLKDSEIKEYDIKITRLNPNQTTKNIVFEIIDSDLLNITGGVIQGMSGSPILQNEFIIGAITHVVVDNPTRGYGIYITNMLEEAEN